MRTQALLLAGLMLVLDGCLDTPTAPDVGTTSDRGAVQTTQNETWLRVTINPVSAVIQAGSSLLFTTVIRDTATGAEAHPPVTWSTGDPGIATVNEDGLVTGIRKGSVAITASCAGGVGTAQVAVYEPTADDGGLAWTFMLSGFGLAPLYDVWGSAPDDVFAVGSSMLWDCCGVILHFDGARWSYMDVPRGTIELFGVWGSSNTDVFAVGSGGAILHYDGSGWNRMASPLAVVLEAVWGASPTDVFVVGYRGTILHYDGATWTVMEGPGESTEWLVDVWGTSGDDVFAVGSGVFHYDGARWTPMATPPTRTLLGVWGAASDDVFAVGVGGEILHYDGAQWQRMPAPNRNGDLLGIWGNGASDIYAVGDRHWWGPEGCCSDVLHYDGQTWNVLPGMSGEALFDVWTTPDGAFIVGAGPTIIRGQL